jgi:hypothetical protein
MAKIYAFFGLFFLLFGCAGSKENNENEIKGDFIYIADAAVIKGDDFIYGVEIDSMLMDLVKKAEPFKKGTFDMVPVVIEGDLNLKEKNAEGWDTIVKITKIVTVGPAKENQDNTVK